jgi:hypothetical protein
MDHTVFHECLIKQTNTFFLFCLGNPNSSKFYENGTFDLIWFHFVMTTTRTHGHCLHKSYCQGPGPSGWLGWSVVYEKSTVEVFCDYYHYLLLRGKARAKEKTHIRVSVWWKTKSQSWGIYTPRIHWIVWGTGTSNDKDKVNKREVCECDVCVCDLETIDTPSIFNLIHGLFNS